MRRNLAIAGTIIIVVALLVNVFNVPLRGYAGRVLDPVGETLNSWAQHSQQVLLDSLGFDSPDAREERSELTRLRLQTAELERLRNENRQLRGELDFVREREFETRQANVVTYQSDAARDMLRINAGSNDGIEAGMPVTSQSVLVGVVEEVTATNAGVLLVTDINFRALAEVDSSAEGIVRGDIGSSIIMERLPRDESITSGGIVTTSGRDGTYPSGLLVGTIRSVAEGTEEIFNTARIRPEIRYRDLEVVTIILES